MTEPTQDHRRPKGRSPSYPAIALEAAIARARQLWERERQHATPVETIVRHWNYKSLNGPAGLTLAALKKFGLISDEGTGRARRARLTDLAIDIVANPRDDVRWAAIKTAALNPPIHREVWDKYGPELSVSDDNMAWWLTRERGFTETGAAEFIPEFRETVAYAQLQASNSVDPRGDDTEEEDERDADIDETPKRDQLRKRRANGHADAREYAIPLASGPEFTVSVNGKLTDEDWTQILAFLNVLKPGLMRRDDDPDLDD